MTNTSSLIDFRGFKRFRPGINVIYSTPSCYLKAVNDYANQHNVSFEVKTDDFFPYANRKNAYWSGYYTSRPNSKRLERIGNNILQVFCCALYIFLFIFSSMQRYFCLYSNLQPADGRLGSWFN